MSRDPYFRRGYRRWYLFELQHNTTSHISYFHTITPYRNDECESFHRRYLRDRIYANRSLPRAQFVPLNPRPMLQGLVDKEVIVKIKWGQEYTGRLVSVDSYMNIQLSGAQEWKDGVDNGVLGQVLIR